MTEARMTGLALAKLIDHTLLRPEATREQVLALCAEARQHGFYSVCVNPSYVPDCVAALEGSETVVCTVIGFPLGATSSEAKAAETRAAVAAGAREVDMVLHVGALREGRDDYVREDVRAVVAASGEALVKVILETALLDDEQKVRACRLVESAGADFVKTSTGFSGGGATAPDIALLRATVGDRLGVKASGGVRTRQDAEALIAAGASRVGASASVAIVSEAGEKSGEA